MPLSERKLPVADDVVAARLDAGTSQRALAAELSAEAGSGVTISRAAVRNAAARHRALAERVAAGDLRSKRERRAARRARPAGTDAVVAARQPEREFAPSRSRTRGPDKADGRIGKTILLDRETFAPVGAAAEGGYGPAFWLNRRDAERDARNDPELQAAIREQDRQQAEAATGLHRDADGVYRAPAGTRWSKARKRFVPAADPEPLTV
jgi:hypothetical protein